MKLTIKNVDLIKDNILMAPLGFDILSSNMDTTNLESKENEICIVRMIFKLYTSNHSIRLIKKRAGIVTNRELKSILNNSIYKNVLDEVTWYLAQQKNLRTKSIFNQNLS